MILVEDDYELKVGMKVNNEEEAYNLYNEYAIRKGFSVRRGTIRRVKGDIGRSRTFCCAKQGHREDGEPFEDKKFNRLVTRCDCKARVVFTVTNGEWEITQLNLDHNHELAKGEERQFLRSGRKIQPAHAGVINSMVDAGIRPTDSYYYLAKEVGGAGNVGFTKRDCHNFLTAKRLNLIKGGDGQSVVNHLKKQLVEDPMFFYAVQFDEESRMTNLFWRDGRSRLDYDCFGDVVMFDTTYRTNKYNMVCAPFVGINQHWKNVFFGCAFLLDETTDSFIWLFETFLESMGNRPPKTIFTDQDQAMANAIAKVFPETCHRLCLWHISKKAAQKIGSHYADRDFKDQFNKCLYNCQNVLEFETTWNNMIRKFNLEENAWLKSLYALKEKWCPTISLDTFSAGARSTQRSDSTNNVFHHISSKTLKLTEFVHHYEDQVKKMRLDELEEDFRCKHGLPSMKINSDILVHAAKVYTIKMYKLFEVEFLGAFGMTMDVVGCEGSVNKYQLNERGHNKGCIVQFCALDCTIGCTCKKFESMGILCRHCLRVLVMKNITKIPAQYILKRWSKEAKKWIRFDDCSDASQNIAKSSKTILLSKFLHLACRIIHRGLETDEGIEYIEKILSQVDEHLDQIDRHFVSLNVVDDTHRGEGEGEGDIAITCGNDTHVSRVLDPPCVRAKGVTNARLKSKLENKRKKKASKGPPTSYTTHPTMLGHDNEPPVFAASNGSFHTPHSLTQVAQNLHPFTTNFNRQLLPIVRIPSYQSSDHMPFFSQASSASLDTANSNAKFIHPWIAPQ